MADAPVPFVLVPVADPMIGTVIGSFIIVKLLGRGGMGAVYLAQHKASPQKRVVFKTILAHLSHNKLMIDRFNTETEAVNRIAHRNIVELRDFGVLPNGQMYLQFEFIDGVPLDRFVADWGGRLSLHRAVYLAFQVCDALDHAHSVGVVHRDLKPDNLLVVVDDTQWCPRLVKIVDFGISKVARSGEIHTLSGMSMGTPYFMSVEQYANAAEANAKSDVYSLAIILWWMITGELPWGRPEPTVLYHLQRTVVPTPPPEHVMPAAVARILLSCFSVDPDDRPTMKELALELAAVIASTQDAPGGGAILAHIARRFLTSSPEHARTVPHPAVANPDGVAAQLWPPIHTPTTPATHDAQLPPLAPLSAPMAEAEPAPSRPVENVTAHASPRALATPAAGVALPSPDAPASEQVATPPAAAALSPAPSPAGARAPRHADSPVMAAMPTGLISQKHLAQTPPIDALAAAPRVRSIVAASEILLATGTPGPQPYAHAELPAVLVSNTQLSGVKPDLGGTTTRAASAPEPPPFLVLPGGAKPRSRGKLLAIGGSLCVLAAAASFVLVTRGSHVAGATSDSAKGNPPTASGAPNGLLPNDAGMSPSEPSTTATAPSLVADAGQFTMNSGSASPGPGATPAASPSVSPAAATVQATGPKTDNTAAVALETLPAKPGPEASRATATHSAAAPKTLHARQLEAQTTGAKTGSLRLLATPWAICWVDGERIDQTPCILDGLPVGRYRVRLENAAIHKDASTIATVIANETTTIERTW